MSDMDDWHITIDKRLERRDAGQGAREQEVELGGAKSRFQRFTERALDLNVADRSWRRGAEGEELVGRKLEVLGGSDWRVVHDVTIGTRGANLDHLLVGPGGVFTVNTKKLNGQIKITTDGVFQNGRSHQMLAKSRAEAVKVHEKLAAQVRFPIEVKAMLVIVQGLRQPEPLFKSSPDGVTVLFSQGLRIWFFRHRKDRVLTPAQAEIVAAAARAPSTWFPAGNG